MQSASAAQAAQVWVVAPQIWPLQSELAWQLPAAQVVLSMQICPVP